MGRSCQPLPRKSATPANRSGPFRFLPHAPRLDYKHALLNDEGRGPRELRARPARRFPSAQKPARNPITASPRLRERTSIAKKPNPAARPALSSSRWCRARAAAQQIIKQTPHNNRPPREVSFLELSKSAKCRKIAVPWDDECHRFLAGFFLAATRACSPYGRTKCQGTAGEHVGMSVPLHPAKMTQACGHAPSTEEVTTPPPDPLLLSATFTSTTPTFVRQGPRVPSDSAKMAIFPTRPRRAAFAPPHPQRSLHQGHPRQKNKETKKTGPIGFPGTPTRMVPPRRNVKNRDTHRPAGNRAGHD